MSERPAQRIQLFATTPRDPTPAEQIENALGNPWRYIQLSLQATEWAHAHGRETAHPDTFLLNLQQTIESAWQMLSLLTAELGGRGLHTMEADLRRKARSCVTRIASWINVSVISIESRGGTTAGIEVPDDVRKCAFQLAQIGVELKSMWIDVQFVPQQQETHPETLSDLQRDLLESLLVGKAFTQDTRMNSSELALKALGKDDPYAVKPALADLSRLSYTRSKTGRNGGHWLTGAKGLAVARAIAAERGHKA